MEKYHFKIITIAVILADNNGTFRGTLKEFCNSLQIKPSSVNITNIKNSLSFLNNNNYIKLIVDKNIYTVSLVSATEKSKHIIKIKRTWYNLIRENHGDAAWESVLKVFLVLIDLKSGEIISYKDIGNATKFSKSTVDRCVKVLDKIDFKDFRFKRKTITKKDIETDTYYTLGQIYDRVIWFR